MDMGARVRGTHDTYRQTLASDSAFLIMLILLLYVLALQSYAPGILSPPSASRCNAASATTAGTAVRRHSRRTTQTRASAGPSSASGLCWAWLSRLLSHAHSQSTTPVSSRRETLLRETAASRPAAGLRPAHTSTRKVERMTHPRTATDTRRRPETAGQSEVSSRRNDPISQSTNQDYHPQQ